MAALRPLHPQVAASDAVHYLTLVDIGRRIASREVSPVDLTERMLDRIGRSILPQELRDGDE